MAVDVGGPAAPRAAEPRDAAQDRGAASPHPTGLEGLRRLAALDEVVRAVERTHAPLYVRVSDGPAVDRCTVSCDHESGCVLPGLSVNPLDPEPWWDRPVEHWVARQLSRSTSLAVEGRHAWLLTGEVSGRGPDCEPLLVAVHPVAVLDDAVLGEAEARYGQVFETDRES